ncbi:MAG TPA: sugar kinase [Propionibacteriaceae bacterium]|nr:sugar kinase [Propionibacteriaceae bacterium]
MTGADASAEVVTGGEAMGLLLASGDVNLSAARQFNAEIAGAESNLAVGLARLGHRVAYYGRVGDDVFGQRIRNELRGEGVDVSALAVDDERPTGLLFRDSVQGAPLTVLYRRSNSAASALSVSDIPEAAIVAARVLHVTGITAALSETAYAATVAAMVLARGAGVHVSFDPNLRLRLAPADRWRQIVDELARHSDTVLTGAEEAEVFCPGQDVISWLTERSVATVVLKHGVDGASEHDTASGDSCREPARQVPVVDPVGAGDAFDAGWLSAWLHGRPAQQRLREGCAVASVVVASRGDCVGLPDARLRDALLSPGPDVRR